MSQPGVVRSHGTRACYLMGVTGSDSANGCRCKPCTAANTLDAKRRQVATARLGKKLIDATDTQAHVAFLRAHRIGLRTIAAHADIDRSTVYRIAQGGQKIRRDIAERILRINLATVTAHLIDATPTRRLIDALVADGWTRKDIAHGIGWAGNALTLASYGRDLIEPASAAKVDDLARREAPHVWKRVHDTLRIEREASDARAAAAERRREYHAARYQRRRDARTDAA